MNKNYELAICELFNPHMHSNINNNNIDSLHYHYLIYTIIDKEEFIDNSYEPYIDLLSRFYTYRLRNSLFSRPINIYNDHPIANYNNIIIKPNYIKLDIIQKYDLDNGEQFAIIKTHFLRLLQRKWKKIYSERMNEIKRKKSINYLLKRELFGK